MSLENYGEDLNPGKRDIMEATHSAVKKHGYSDLTIQDIADEFERSKSLLYYHYDGRDDLLVDFLDYILGGFLTNLPEEGTAPRQELDDLIELLLPTTIDEEPYRLMLAMFELRMNAPHDQAVREQYLEVEEELRAILEDILQRGIEADVFLDVDVEVEAEALLSLLVGTRARRLTVYEPDQSIEILKTAINAHIDRISTENT
ncbi:TetR/AcrR family transcriptional regulator [Halobacterium salinarum]|jgi:AcrR family transcriptional regulator|uniref:TetR/AcrR family transcriptional regulator n=1 Tax=Halobacterium salinarum TaxID=2242 RepID=UPI0025576407|nr:TetR/AcrR family transcriptional regulator [Halobacterium salinarum]MDL0126615.1 TetR/AcrR family transcriptional regulator [Halobacterium salinarum]